MAGYSQDGKPDGRLPRILSFAQKHSENGGRNHKFGTNVSIGYYLKVILKWRPRQNSRWRIFAQDDVQS